MNVNKEFTKLLNNWKEQDPKFKQKFKSYRSKHLKSLIDSDAERIGYWKKIEMLIESGYIEIKTKKQI